MQNSDINTRITSLYGSQTSPVDLWMQNSALRTRMTLVYWFQSSSVVLCIQNSYFSNRISSLYGSQPSFVVFACKRATLGPELQVSMGPRLHLCFLHSNIDFSTRIASLYGSQSSSVVFAYRTPTFGLLDPAFICCFVHSIHSLFCGFCDQNSDFWIWIACLYGSQTSPVDLWMKNSVLRSRITFVQLSQHGLCIQNSDFSIRITSLYGSQHSFVVFACKTAALGPELQVSMGPSLHLWFCALKTATLASELLVSTGSSRHLWLWYANQVLLDQN